MSEDTYGKSIHLPCGHWIYQLTVFSTEGEHPIDGCAKCRKLEMRDSKDRREPRKH